MSMNLDKKNLAFFVYLDLRISLKYNLLRLRLYRCFPLDVSNPSFILSVLRTKVLGLLVTNDFPGKLNLTESCGVLSSRLKTR